MTDVWATVAELDGATQERLFADERFDVAVFDSTLSHVPEPERALAEAFRVLRPGGCLAAFDGDYATATVALGHHDPLQVCVDAMMAGSVNDRRVMRRLPSLTRECGLEPTRTRSHGFIETGDGGYMLTVITAAPTCSKPREGSVRISPLR